MIVRPLIALWLIPLCTLIGCGGGGGGKRLPTAPVAGKVTLDGQPFGPGLIEFLPAAAATGASQDESRTAIGRIGSDGSFKMGSYEATDGVVPGPYTVRLVGGSDDPSMPGPEVPVESFSVTISEEGQSQLDVPLKARKGAKSGEGLMKRSLETGASTKL